MSVHLEVGYEPSEPGVLEGKLLARVHQFGGRWSASGVYVQTGEHEVEFVGFESKEIAEKLKRMIVRWVGVRWAQVY